MTRALVIAPQFFGYYQDICKELSCHGIEVDYISDRPSEGVLFKSLGRLDYRLVDREIDHYYQSVLAKVKSCDYDLILFVGGMSICFKPDQIYGIKTASNANMVLYLWDALQNCQRVKPSLESFNAVLSFDPDDCKKENLAFLPLFYTHDYEAIPILKEELFDYDACFIGSVHQISKFKNVLKTIKQIEREGARVFSFFYMPSKSAGMLRKMQSPLYRDVELQYVPLKREEIISIITRSKTIIDSPQSHQKGLTMRSIEALGARRRLATSNPNVVDYDFYKSGNVIITDEGGLKDIQFFTSIPDRYENDVREKYSIESWVSRILDLGMR